MRRRLGAQIIIFHSRHCWRRPHREAVPRHRVDELRSSLRRRRRGCHYFGREERPRVAEEGVLGVVEEGPAFGNVGRGFLNKTQLETCRPPRSGCGAPRRPTTARRTSGRRRWPAGGNMSAGFPRSRCTKKTKDAPPSTPACCPEPTGASQKPPSQRGRRQAPRLSGTRTTRSRKPGMHPRHGELNSN